jgi:hypothetical protein
LNGIEGVFREYESFFKNKPDQEYLNFEIGGEKAFIDVFCAEIDPNAQQIEPPSLRSKK